MKRGRKILGLFLLLLIAGCVIIYNVNTNIRRAIKAAESCAGINPSVLTYRVFIFGIIPAGTATIKDAEDPFMGKPSYHIQADFTSADFLNFIFSAKARLDSYLDKKSFNPVVFRQKTSLKGKSDAYKEVIYDQDKLTMTIGNEVRAVLPNTQDPLSAIFNIRRMDFDVVQEYDLNLNTNQKNYMIKGTASKIMAAGQKAGAIVGLSAEIKRRDKNNPYHKSKLTMYLYRIGNTYCPVLIKVFASGFLITARLICAQ